MRNRNERGAISAIGLCILMTVLLLGLAATQFMRSGSSVAAEYEREMQLRLAAESGVETAAAQIERYAVPNVGERTRVDVDGVPMAAGIELHVYIERSKERSGREFLDVIAAAVDRAGTRIPDGEDWTRAKTVRGRMEKKGDRYVWRRWY